MPPSSPRDRQGPPSPRDRSMPPSPRDRQGPPSSSRDRSMPPSPQRGPNYAPRDRQGPAPASRIKARVRALARATARRRQDRATRVVAVVRSPTTPPIRTVRIATPRARPAAIRRPAWHRPGSEPRLDAAAGLPQPRAAGASPSDPVRGGPTPRTVVPVAGPATGPNGNVPAGPALAPTRIRTSNAYLQQQQQLKAQARAARAAAAVAAEGQAAPGVCARHPRDARGGPGRHRPDPPGPATQRRLGPAQALVARPQPAGGPLRPRGPRAPGRAGRGPEPPRGHGPRARPQRPRRGGRDPAVRAQGRESQAASSSGWRRTGRLRLRRTEGEEDPPARSAGTTRGPGGSGSTSVRPDRQALDLAGRVLRRPDGRGAPTGWTWPSRWPSSPA